MLSALCFLLFKNWVYFIEDIYTLCYTYHRDDSMKKMLILFILFFTFLTSANAQLCSTQEKLKYVNEAVKVTASYEFLKDETGRSYFKITVYNLSPNVMAFYEDRDGIQHDAYGENGSITYSFNDYDIDNAYTYKFNVSVIGTGGCVSSVTTFSLVKPKRNYFYDNVPECKFEKMKDYYYCKEWINNDFYVDSEVIIRNIKSEFNKTTTIVSEEEEISDNLVTFLQLYIKYRVYILVGLGIGIIIDIVYIFLSYKRIKEGEF